VTSCALTGRPEQENGSHDDGRGARNHSGLPWEMHFSVKGDAGASAKRYRSADDVV
jgi:hypothetical protein